MSNKQAFCLWSCLVAICILFIYLFHIAMILLFCFWWKWELAQKQKWLLVIHLCTAIGTEIPLLIYPQPWVYWTRPVFPVVQIQTIVRRLIPAVQCQIRNLQRKINTLIASWKNRIVINMPNNSPAILVNLVIIVQALKIASRINMSPVQTQTLQYTIRPRNIILIAMKYWGRQKEIYVWSHTKQPKLETTWHPALAFLCWNRIDSRTL